MEIKDLLEYCVITNIVIYDMKTNEACFRGSSNHVSEWLEERKIGNRKVSHYYVNMNKLYIVVE